MASRLQLSLFGHFKIELDGKPVCERLTRRTYPRRVLQFLASAPSRVETRSALAGALWPGDQTDKLPNRLHQAIHFLRGELNLIPEAIRPQVLVDHERVSLELPDGIDCDAVQFFRLLSYDGANPEARLGVLLEAASLARDDYAADWTDTNQIGLRQARFRRELTQALREAAQIAQDLGQLETCFRAGEQLCRLELATTDDHLDHAQRLSQAGRPDAAIAHCQQVRDAGNLQGADAWERLDSFVRKTQQSNNGNSIELAADRLNRRTRKHQVEAPICRPLGFQEPIQNCVNALKSPYSRVLTIAGPPGAGKTTLAREVAFQIQSEFDHGVIQLDGYRLTDLRSLVSQLANELDVPLADWMKTIRERELLIVIDGVDSFSELAAGIGELMTQLPTVSWLTTSLTALSLTAERVVTIDSRQLLLRTSADEIPAAVAIIAQPLGVEPDSLFQSPQIMAAAEALDALPLALLALGKRLQSSTPEEVLQVARETPEQLFETTSLRAERRGLSREPLSRVRRMIEQLDTSAARLLHTLSGLQSWLSRPAIASLCDSDPSPELLLDRIARQHLVNRITARRDGQTISLFRPSALARAAISGKPGHPAASEIYQSWLGLKGHTPQAILSNPARRGVWFDDHFADLHDLMSRWSRENQLKPLAQLCGLFGDHWLTSRFCVQIAHTLQEIAGLERPAPSKEMAQILVCQARLQAGLGNQVAATDAAKRALAQASAVRDRTARFQASSLLSGTGSRSLASPVRKDPDADHGVKTASNLLRVAQLAARSSDIRRALEIADDASQVSRYFGLHALTLDALRFKARLAMALGHTTSAAECAAQIELLSAECQELEAQPCADLVRAEVLLSQRRFTEAAQLGTTVAASADATGQPELSVRATRIIAWAHHEQGAWRICRALCADLREQSGVKVPVELASDVQLLNTLAAQRLGDRLEARQSLVGLGETWQRNQYADESRQTRLNLAEIAINAGRRDLARIALHSPGVGRPPKGEIILPWEKSRLVRVNDQLEDGTVPSASAPTPADSLASAALLHAVSDAIEQTISA